MAAADDRGPLALPAASGGTPRRGVLGIVGLLLALAFAAVAVLQERQHELLSETASLERDYTVVIVFQAETEYLRLKEAWTQAVDERQSPDLAALQLRYDIWVSRISLLNNQRQRDPAMAPQGRGDETMAAIEAFIARADAQLGPSAAGPSAATRDALARLLPELERLAAPMQALSLATTHQVATERAYRDALVRRTNQVGLALTGFLVALTLAFAWIALRQLRLLEQRKRVLEDLASHLREARRKALAADEAKSVFLSHMSHEIRTPFQGVLGMLGLLRETPLSARQREYVQVATSSADHLLGILDDLLDMSQLEAGRITLVPAPLDLRALVAEVEALMRPRAAERSLALEVSVDHELPPRVVADGKRLRQILFNLLDNAVKFTDDGQVRLEVRCIAAHGETVPVAFIVTDSGIGMDDATVARLFSPSPAASRPVHRRSGAGLGLEISRGLARLMGGELSASSRPGEGSRFVLELPLREATMAPLPAAPDALGEDAGEQAMRLHVLVAEDHPVNRQYLAALLENLGHRARFAEDGRQALLAVGEAADDPFDIVLMDLHMPTMDGAEATRAIRQLADTRAATVPIVALTADGYPATRERCLAAGMNDFLVKPVVPARLSTLLRRLYGPAGRGDAPGAHGEPASVARSGEPPALDPSSVHQILQAIPRERLAGLVADFLQQGVHTAEQMHSAVREARAADLQACAHGAHGAALHLGLAALAETARELKEGAMNLPAHEIARLVQRFEQQLGAARTAAAEAGLTREAAPAGPTA